MTTAAKPARLPSAKREIDPRYYSEEAGGTTLHGLHAFLDTLRRLGVRRYEGMLDEHPVSVEFFPQAPLEVPVSDRQPMDAQPDPMCECGHHVADHNEEGACIHACETKKCSV